MPGRQSHLRPPEDRDEGTKESRAGYLPLQPVDAPAPPAPSVPQRADGATPKTGRESHRPAARTPDGGAGPMETSGPFLPAATLQRPAAAVTSTGSVTAAASSLAAWILDHAREDRIRGRHVPDEIAGHVRHLLQPPTSAHGSTPAPPTTVEVSTALIARRMECSERWVRHLCQVGKLRARRSGRDWLITVEEEHSDDPERRHTG
jgi:hypothetical protein